MLPKCKAGERLIIIIIIISMLSTCKAGEKICSKTLCIMSNVKVFTKQEGGPAGQMARQMNKTDYTALYATHMVQTSFDVVSW